MKPGITTCCDDPRVTSGRCRAARSAYGPTSTTVPSRWKTPPSGITDASVLLRTFWTTYLPRINDDAMARLLLAFAGSDLSTLNSLHEFRTGGGGGASRLVLH